MLGLMQQQALSVGSLIDFAEKHHGDVEIVSRRIEGDIHPAHGPPLHSAHAKSPMLWTNGRLAKAPESQPWRGTAIGIWSCISG